MWYWKGQIKKQEGSWNRSTCERNSQKSIMTPVKNSIEQGAQIFSPKLSILLFTWEAEPCRCCVFVLNQINGKFSHKIPSLELTHVNKHLDFKFLYIPRFYTSICHSIQLSDANSPCVWYLTLFSIQFATGCFRIMF